MNPGAMTLVLLAGFGAFAWSAWGRWRVLARAAPADRFDRTGERVLYINGQEADYDPNSTFLDSVANTSNLEIGYGFEGQMDDIMIFNRALSPVEMRTMMDASTRTWTPVTLGNAPNGPPYPPLPQ